MRRAFDPIDSLSHLFLVLTYEEAQALAQLQTTDPAAQRALAKICLAVDGAAAVVTGAPVLEPVRTRAPRVTRARLVPVPPPIDDDYVPWRDEAHGIYR